MTNTICKASGRPTVSDSRIHAALVCPVSRCDERQSLDGPDTDLLGDLRYARLRLKSGQSVYCAGDRFESLFAIRSGFFKSRVRDSHGREQIIAFHMVGELLGLDGVASDWYRNDAVALEDSEVLIIPYAQILDRGLQHSVQKVMSRELARRFASQAVVGTMNAEERVAAFLLEMSRRLLARGLSPVEFHLRMTRGEIGSYLGLSLETISRAFSNFAARGVISVDQKHVWIRDIAGLRQAVHASLL